MGLTPDIYDEVFKGAFVVRTGPWDALVEELRNDGWDVSQIGRPRFAKTVWHERTRGTTVCLLWFSDEALGDASLASVLAHECHHAAWFTLSERGISSEMFAEEVGAYYQEWLMLQVIALLKSRMKRRRPTAGPRPNRRKAR